MIAVVTTDCVEATRSVGIALGELADPGDVVILTGELGAGKTVIAKGAAAGLAVGGEVTSPTFNILLVYPGRLSLNHFDLYRLESSDQLDDVAYWETIESDGLSLVEWGDKFPRAVPADSLVLRVSATSDTARRIELEPNGDRSIELASALLERVADLPGVTLDGITHE